MENLPASSFLSENLAVKSNELIKASYAMTVNEQRLLLACISQIDSWKRLDEKNAKFTLTVEQVRDLFYTAENEQNVFRDLKAATKRLFKREVLIDLGSGEELLTHFVQSARFKNGERAVEIWFATEIIPYLSQLEANFTKYRLKNVARLTSSHAIRIFELIVSWAGQGLSFKEMGILEFRDLLRLGEKYKSFSLFRKYVTDLAVVQINANTDFALDISFKKFHRAFDSIQLRFNRKSDMAEAARREQRASAAVTEENRLAAEVEKTAQREAFRRRYEAVKAALPSFPKGTVFTDKKGKKHIAPEDNIFFSTSTANGLNIGIVSLETLWRLIASGNMTVELPVSAQQDESFNIQDDT